MDDVATTAAHPDDGGVVILIFGAFSVVVGLGDGSWQKAHLTDQGVIELFVAGTGRELPADGRSAPPGRGRSAGVMSRWPAVRKLRASRMVRSVVTAVLMPLPA